MKLAKTYHADVEIVELGALLHDISMPSEYGSRKEHHIYGEKIAEELLTKLKFYHLLLLLIIQRWII